MSPPRQGRDESNESETRRGKRRNVNEKLQNRFKEGLEHQMTKMEEGQPCVVSKTK
jgi:hypothetical protein